MSLKYIPVLLTVIGIIAFVSADEQDKCDGNAYDGKTDCKGPLGKFVFDGQLCNEIMFFYNDGIEQLQCVKPEYEFNTIAECLEKCKDRLVDISGGGDVSLLL